MIEHWPDGYGAEVAYRVGQIAADHRATGALRRRPARWSERRRAHAARASRNVH